MDTVFAGSVEVRVLRNGKEIARVVRPLRRTPSGPVVRYKRRLWAVSGNSIDVSGAPISEGSVAATPSDGRENGLVGEDENITGNEAIAQPTNSIRAVQDGGSMPDPSGHNVGQDEILQAGPDQRLLVDAGPGTGKTHTACLKVATLIRDQDVPAARIWIISFTRTAVHEIRNRLTTLLCDPSESSAVRIVTLDSLAWTIHSGFSGQATLNGSYDENISQTLAQILTNPELRDEMTKVRHVIIDEAQDIVSIRAELVLAIVDAVGTDCGVTVFADQAQAIYGWTEDQENSAVSGVSLLSELEDRGFTSLSLTEIHRTDSPALLRIFRDVRKKVLDGSSSAVIRAPEIRSDIEQFADADIGPIKNLDLSALPTNALVLMRQRSDVLTASSYNQGTPHRLRLSGLPVRMLPWLGLLFWDYAGRRLMRPDFDRLWQDRLADQPGPWTVDAAWQLLYETAGESRTVIDLHRLRAIIGRSNPPAPFTSPDYGDDGPIIGTIHASKGREAEEVFLYLPPQTQDNQEGADPEEEVRVMFVGATRARKKLSVGSSSGQRPRNVDGRYWKRVSGNRVQIEIGRAHDIQSSGLVGKSTFAKAADALAAQRLLASRPVLSGLYARVREELGWKLALETEGETRLGALSEKMSADLREIANRCDCWPPPKFLPHIRSIGLRTIAVRTDDADLDQLHEPWRTSGFLLAPMIVGICPAKLKS